MSEIKYIIQTKELLCQNCKECEECKNNNKCDKCEEKVKEHINKLLTKFNNVLFFAGAGASVDAGYPLMTGLLKDLKNDANIKKIIEDTQAKIIAEKDKNNLETILNNIEKKEDRETVETALIKILNDVEKNEININSLITQVKKSECCELLMGLFLKALQEEHDIKKIIEDTQKEITDEKDKNNLETILNNIKDTKEKKTVETKLITIVNDILNKVNDLETILNNIKKKEDRETVETALIKILNDVEKNEININSLITQVKKSECCELLMGLFLKALQEEHDIKKIIEDTQKEITDEKDKNNLETILNNIKDTKEKKTVETKLITIVNDILNKVNNLETILNNIEEEEDRKTVEEALIKILNDKEKNVKAIETHTDLIKKINSFLPNHFRLKIFTTNYDTLFEKACNKINYIVNDGFVFTDNEYNPLNFGYELIKNKHNDIIDYIPNLIHLYKLHGSLNWKKITDTKIIKVKNTDEVKNPVLIYPNNNKYKDSYNLPYLDMISEFNSALQIKDTLLIICGYSFSDPHLNNIIERAFTTNNKIHIVIIDPCYDTKHHYYTKATKLNNITMLRCELKDFNEKFLENKLDYLEEDHNFYNNKDTYKGE